MPSGTSFDPRNSNDFEKSKLFKNAKGAVGTIPAGTIGTVDLALADDCLIMGGFLLVQGAVWGDKVDFQVVMGTTVLAEFIQDWYIDPTVCNQSTPGANYPAKLPAGATLRLEYYSTGSSPVNVAVNYNMEKVLT